MKGGSYRNVEEHNKMLTDMRVFSDIGIGRSFGSALAMTQMEEKKRNFKSKKELGEKIMQQQTEWENLKIEIQKEIVTRSLTTKMIKDDPKIKELSQKFLKLREEIKDNFKVYINMR